MDFFFKNRQKHRSKKIVRFAKTHQKQSITKVSIERFLCNFQITFIFGTQKAGSKLKNKIFGENCVFQRGLILLVLSGRKLGIEAIRPKFPTRKIQYETSFTLLFANIST